MEEKVTGTSIPARYLRPNKSVLAGEFSESRVRVQQRRRLRKSVGPPFPILTQCVIDPRAARTHLIEQGFGASEAALQVLEHSSFSKGERESCAFARVSLRELGFTEPPSWVQLLMEGRGVCALPDAAELLPLFKGGEVGDGCRVLTIPVYVEGNWHHFYVSGNGPMLYAFPHHLATTFSLDMEIIVRIEI